MNDLGNQENLENRIRQALTDPCRELPAWPDPMRRVRRSARRQRARLAGGSAVLAGVVAVVVAVAAVSLPRSARPRPGSAAPGCPGIVADAAAVLPQELGGRIVTHLVQPGALAVGPAGQLYVADSGRNEILQALPGGRFQVIAGDGKAGFSGDGGPATTAAIDDPGGMTVTRTGTIYFADTGNNRIRAISPSGIISTVAGDGRYGGWAAGGTPAGRTALASPADVAIGPDGCLYIADEGNSEIFRLDAAGRLVRVAGTPGAEGVAGIGGRAVDASPDGPDGLAFDQAGNLYVAGFTTKNLLMITASGRMLLPVGQAGFYPHGPGGLVYLPGQGVIGMNEQTVQRITAHGLHTMFNLAGDRVHGVGAFLPDGIAVAATGTIYADTFAGNGYASRTALIAIRPGGHISVLWKS
jgi:sugar lactone lactonase YvrE